MTRETRAARAARAQRILLTLDELYPEARCELDHADPWQLLVAVVLSAQCTDAKVNQVTPGLLAALPSPAAMAGASPDDVEQHIRSLGLFRNKARNLVAAARILVAEHGGQVPCDRAALQALPGVGRKSASVVLAVAFGVPALAVDTHVGRLAVRLGLSPHHDPAKVEQDLCALYPEHQWVALHHALIWHGRRLCTARNPGCDRCPVRPDCPRIGVAGAKAAN